MLFTKPNVLEGLGGVEVGGVRQAAGLQVFGLKWSAGDGHDYATLDEALEKQMLDISEVDAGGRVPTLKLVNKSERMVFLMAGEAHSFVSSRLVKEVIRLRGNISRATSGFLDLEG